MIFSSKMAKILWKIGKAPAKKKIKKQVTLVGDSPKKDSKAKKSVAGRKATPKKVAKKK